MLGNELLAALGLQLGELFGEVGLGSEYRCSIGCLVNDVDEGSVVLAVLLEEGGNGFSSGGYVLGLEVSVRVPGLGELMSGLQLRGSIYSFWASMMTSTLSLVEAVDGPTPTKSLKLFVIVKNQDGYIPN